MITYVKGDATQPIGDGPKVITHICNDQGKWGAGFVLALSARNPLPEQAYRRWYTERGKTGTPFRLGEMQLVSFAPNTMVCNMIAQQGFGMTRKTESGDVYVPPIRYAWLSSCFTKLTKALYYTPEATIHMPRIGCGLAGGEWSKIEILIEYFLVNRGFAVTVYNL